MSFQKERKLSDGIDQSNMTMEERSLLAVKDSNPLAIHKTKGLSAEAHNASLDAFEKEHQWQHIISIHTTYD